MDSVVRCSGQKPGTNFNRFSACPLTCPVSTVARPMVVLFKAHFFIARGGLPGQLVFYHCPDR